MDLVRETIEACKLILELTHWQIRLLSKSNLLPIIARELPRDRIIYGVSTGTLDDKLTGTPGVSGISSLVRQQPVRLVRRCLLPQETARASSLQIVQVSVLRWAHFCSPFYVYQKFTNFGSYAGKAC